MMSIKVARVFLFTFISIQLISILSPILPTIQNEFNVNAFQVTLVIFILVLGRMIVSLPLGYIFSKDRLKKLLIIFLLLSALGFYMCFRAQSFVFFLFSIFVAGVGSAALMMLMLIYVSATSISKRRKKLLGVFQSSMLIASAVAPVYSGILNQLYNWRVIFLGLAVFLIFIIILNFRSNFDENDKQDEIISDNEKVANDKKINRGINWPAVISINFVSFCLLFTMGSFSRAIIPLVGDNIFKLTSSHIGLSLSIIELLRFLVVVGGSYIAIKYSNRHVLVPGLLIGGISMVFLTVGGGLSVYYAGIIMFGLGRVGNNFNIGILCEHIPENKISFLTSVNRFVCDTGLLLGTVVLGWIMNNYSVLSLGILSAVIIWIALLGLLFFTEEKDSREVEGY